MSFGSLRRVAAAFLLASVVVAVTLVAGARAETSELAGFASRTFGAGAELRRVEVDGAAVLEARHGETWLGTAFSTWDVIRSVGYSGEPLDIWVTMDSSLKVVSARLVRQNEPLLVVGVAPEQLLAYVAGFAGIDIRTLERVSTTKGEASVDHIAGATISSGVLRDAVIRAARKTARATHRLGAPGRLLRDRWVQANWRALVATGAVVEKRLTAGELPLDEGPAIDPSAPLLDVTVALATPAGIGRNLFEHKFYDGLISSIAPDADVVFVAAGGLLSVKGNTWRQTGVFDRLAIVQGDRTLRLTKEMYRPLQTLGADGAPDFREYCVFVIPHETGFESSKPWRLQALAVRSAPSGAEKTALLEVSYAVPAEFLAPASAEEDRAAWREVWMQRRWEVAGLGVMLAGLVVILLFQDQFAARARLYRPVRILYMGLTLVFLGFFARAQLSVVQVVTFAQALRSDFRWSFFLLDPMIFLLWGFVAVAMIFWGRGVFCGWLCPFGALQELLNEIARRLKIPQFEPPWGLHERLGMIKYLIFLAIFALSLNDMRHAFLAAEAEPFKTAVVLRFVRDWPFVVYAGLLLAAGLFVRRAYCRYLCPLGAALALPARLRLFEWLRRRPQCGRECRQCAAQCPVGAIQPSGAISPNECIYCLNCQSLYHDPQVCLGLKAREGRRAAREQMVARAAEKGTSHEG